MEATDIKNIVDGVKSNGERLILEGEAYCNFVKTLRSPHTKKTYISSLITFMKYKKFTSTNQLLLGETKLIQSYIIECILYLKETNGLSSQTLTVFTAALKHFYNMNDIILNWKKINSFIGELVRTVKDRAYSRKEIEEVLEKCDERKRVMILLQTSAGLRIGALPELKIKHLNKIERYGIYRISVYEGTSDEYYCFCSPECARAIDNYLQYRRLYHEQITPQSPLIREQFDKTNPFMTKACHITRHTMTWTISQALQDAGVRKKRTLKECQRRQKRHEIMNDHGFRKFYDTTLTNAGIHPLYIELLEGHRVKGVKDSYFKPSENDLLEGNDKMRGYISAINDLTIDESQRLQQELIELKERGDQIQKLRKEKDIEIRDIKQTLQSILSVISNSKQPVDRNMIAQQLILKGIYKTNQ